MVKENHCKPSTPSHRGPCLITGFDYSQHCKVMAFWLAWKRVFTRPVLGERSSSR